MTLEEQIEKIVKQHQCLEVPDMFDQIIAELAVLVREREERAIDIYIKVLSAAKKVDEEQSK